MLVRQVRRGGVETPPPCAARSAQTPCAARVKKVPGSAYDADMAADCASYLIDVGTKLHVLVNKDTQILHGVCSLYMLASCFYVKFLPSIVWPV